MNSASSKPAASIGFLTVVENTELGLVGGYLLLNAAARPLEFHCTAPVKPTRTQEILYGPTLRPFLFGEQIGQTLLAKSKLTPVVVCTDTQPVLAAREGTHVSLVLVADGISSAVNGGFSLAKNMVMTAPGFENDERAIREAWPALADHLDLLEPFARIREALDEAQKVTRQAA
jgi:hypothetical protein